MEKPPPADLPFDVGVKVITGSKKEDEICIGSSQMGRNF